MAKQIFDVGNPEAEDFSYKFLIERHSDGYKILAAGNGAGAIALGAALHYFADKPQIILWAKASAISFFIGLLILVIAYLSLVRFIGSVFSFNTTLSMQRNRKPDATVEREISIHGLLPVRLTPA